jgi:hypothetical protein
MKNSESQKQNSIESLQQMVQIEDRLSGLEDKVDGIMHEGEDTGVKKTKEEQRLPGISLKDQATNHGYKRSKRGTK